MVLISITILPSGISSQRFLFKKYTADLFSRRSRNSCRVLGSIIDSNIADKKFVERSEKQQKSVKELTVHANVSHQNVHISYTSSVQRKLTYLACT